MNLSGKQLAALIGVGIAVLIGIAGLYLREQRIKLGDETAALRAASEKNQQQHEQAARRTEVLTRATADAKQQREKLAQQTAETETVTETARQQTGQLDAANANVQEQREHYKRAVGLMEGLRGAQQMRISVMEYYQTEGRWPVSNKAMGAFLPDEFRTTLIDHISVEPFGKTARIRIAVNSPTGTTQHISLIANESRTGQISWDCSSEDIKDISKYVSACEYR